MESDEILASIVTDFNGEIANTVRANVEKVIGYLGEAGIEEAQALLMLRLACQTGFIFQELKTAMIRLVEEMETNRSRENQ
jgi:hypothetical protein